MTILQCVLTYQGLPPKAIRPNPPDVANDRGRMRAAQARVETALDLDDCHWRVTISAAMTNDNGPFGPPGLGLLALEGRAWLEFAALLPAWPLLERTPRGDGHPVLVIPGGLASDRSTQALRWFLRRRGYYVHGWQLGRNHGPSADVVTALAQRFTAVREQHQRKVSLIGWSLGGIYARELARHFPNEVRQVITLASPFRDSSASNATRLF